MPISVWTQPDRPRNGRVHRTFICNVDDDTDRVGVMRAAGIAPEKVVGVAKHNVGGWLIWTITVRNDDP